MKPKLRDEILDDLVETALSRLANQEPPAGLENRVLLRLKRQRTKWYGGLHTACLGMAALILTLIIAHDINPRSSAPVQVATDLRYYSSSAPLQSEPQVAASLPPRLLQSDHVESASVAVSVSAQRAREALAVSVSSRFDELEVGPSKERIAFPGITIDSFDFADLMISDLEISQ